MSAQIPKHKNSASEGWCLDISPNYIGTWYEQCSLYARDWIGPGRERECLVIGSPVAEAVMLAKNGWDVTYADVRTPPHKFDKFTQCDAAALPFEDDSFDAVSTACVLTHVGLGRYGDPKHERGDKMALGHIARVLKPGMKAAITFGAVIDALEGMAWGTTHRIYTKVEALEMLADAGLEVLDVSVYDNTKRRWLRVDEKPAADPNRFDYLSTFVQKPC